MQLRCNINRPIRVGVCNAGLKEASRESYPLSEERLLMCAFDVRVLGSSKRSHRSLGADEYFMAFSAYLAVLSPRAELPLAHANPIRAVLPRSPVICSSGMTGHSLVIICCYLYTLLDMAAPHFS